MGQYHILVNLSNKQFVHPHRIGNGLKLREQIGSSYSTATVLTMLLAASNGRGGGDFHSDSPLIGSWAGCRVAFIGDYAEKGDIPKTDAVKIYDDICGCDGPENGWEDISAEVRHMMGQEFDIHYTGEPDGWLDIKQGLAPEPEKPKAWVEGNPLVEFCYPKSDGSDPYRRVVRVISADKNYITGLDTGDKNRFKQFNRKRITKWLSRELLLFQAGIAVNAVRPE